MDKQEKEYSSLVKNLLILNELIVQNSMNFRLIHLWIDKAKPKKKKTDDLWIFHKAGNELEWSNTCVIRNKDPQNRMMQQN